MLATVLLIAFVPDSVYPLCASVNLLVSNESDAVKTATDEGEPDASKVMTAAGEVVSVPVCVMVQPELR